MFELICLILVFLIVLSFAYYNEKAKQKGKMPFDILEKNKLHKQN
ncbi:hypothetical protein [Arcobacter sp. CECT 8985]|nr:hypothetical protein [Arcobacter sp. CECT 8985]